MKKIHPTDWIVFVLVLVPFIYLAVIYPQLPDTVPTHFDIHGKADQFSQKNTVWILTSILGATSLGIYYLLKFLPRIDPKKNARYSSPVFKKIGMAVVLLLFFITTMFIRAAQTGVIEMAGYIPVLIGLFFAFMGNLMHSIKPNYSAHRGRWKVKKPGGKRTGWQANYGLPVAY